MCICIGYLIAFKPKNLHLKRRLCFKVCGCSMCLKYITSWKRRAHKQKVRINMANAFLKILNLLPLLASNIYIAKSMLKLSSEPQN